MRHAKIAALFAALILFAGAAGAETRTTHAQFERLLHQVADGWNANDAAKAADAFAADAIYSEPPAKQLYRGREALYKFFGGPQGRKEWMRMTWHNISFNETTQVGAGEFTYAWPGGQVHGVVSIRVRAGLIANWREYFYESPLEWEKFQGENRF
jgi:hypothetical protein